MPPAAHLERELKLDPGREPIDLATLGEPLEPRTFVSTYYDTETRSLARSGLTLRRRVENGASLWQLKLPADEGRIEIELRAGPRPPAELVSVLAAHLRRERLERVATLRTRRSGVRVTRRGRSAADVLRDEVTVLEDRRAVGAFEELEVELIDGDTGDLRRIEKQLRGAGAIVSTGVPKLARVIGDRRPARSGDGSPSEHLVAVLTVQLAELLACDALLLFSRSRGRLPGVSGRAFAGPVATGYRFRKVRRAASASFRASAPPGSTSWLESWRSFRKATARRFVRCRRGWRGNAGRRARRFWADSPRRATSRCWRRSSSSC